MKKKGGSIKDADIYSSEFRQQSYKNTKPKTNDTNWSYILIGTLFAIGGILLLTKILKKKTYECTNGKCREFDSNIDKNKKRGDFNTLEDCNKKCSLPKFSCTKDDRCIEDKNGNYSTLEDCKKKCNDNNN